MGLFYFLFAVDTLAALAVVYFFVVGVAEGSVSSFNIALWLTILAAVAAVIGGGFTLNRYGRRSAAKLVLAILGVPALLYGLFIVLLVVMQPNWH
jgi:hypothetical protein